MLGDITHPVSRKRPPLLPIFRSAHQLRLLGYLYTHAGSSISLADIQRRTRIPQQTVSREVARLSQAGLLTSRTFGRMKLSSANEASPYFPDLRNLLLKAVGPTTILAEHLERVRSIALAYVFGSWARRYGGEIGPPPADIDVVVIGDPDPDAVAAACRAAERRLGMQVNPITLSPSEWESQATGFVRGLRKGPLIPIVGDAS